MERFSRRPRREYYITLQYLCKAFTVSDDVFWSLAQFVNEKRRYYEIASPLFSSSLPPTTRRIMLGVAATALTLLTAASGVEAGVHRYVSSSSSPRGTRDHAS